jgi:subtilisin family serine protease
MKKIEILSILLLCVNIQIYAQSPYYYYKGQKVDLTVDKSCLNIIANDNISQISKTQLQTIDIEIDDTISVRKIAKVKFTTTLSEEEYVEKINTLKQTANIKHVMPYFKRENADPISISDVFYVKLKNREDTVLLKQVALQKGVRIEKQVPYMPFWYIMSLQNSISGNTLDVANFFYETGYFEDIDPAFLFNFRATCTNDPLFNQLWGLHNSSNQAIDINACEAWNISMGTGIKIAVVDQGIDATHNDLSTNINSLSFDAQSGTSPSVFISGNTHGTHVAGTVAAVRNNNLQVVGVAPNAQIMRVSHSLYISSTISAELASGISWSWQNGSDVITNSWGDQGSVYYNNLHSSILENAITAALTQGRNGKGCVVAFAAGNHAPAMDYPASFHNDIITIGSISSSGVRASSSGYGNQLDVVAPGVNILSTLPNNGTGTMSGTSMATPHVAGIAALILSVRPDLTQAQVRQAIESTCTKLSGYSFSTNSNHPNGTWNNQVGHGLVNAYAALHSLFNFSIAGPKQFCSSATYTIPGLPNNYTVQWTVRCERPPLSQADDQTPLVTTTVYNTRNLTLPGLSTGLSGYYYITATISGPIFNNIQAYYLAVSGPPSPYTGYLQYTTYDGQSSDMITNQVHGNPITLNSGESICMWLYYCDKINNDTYIDSSISFDLDCNGNITSSEQGGTGPFICAEPCYYNLNGTYGNYIRLVGKNNCGTSVNAFYIPVIYSSSTYYSFAYPNPVSDILNVNIDLGASLKARLSKTISQKVTAQKTSCDIRLYNIYGNLKRQVNGKDGITELKVSNLSEGIYFLHIYDGNSAEPEIHTIIIKH